MGESTKSSDGCLGLLNIAPDKPLWDFPLRPDAIDDYKQMIADGHSNPRSVAKTRSRFIFTGEFPFGEPVADLSIGGCYVETTIPIQLASRLKVGIWLGQTKVWAEARVTHSTPGLGIGIRFTGISEPHLDQIKQFLQSLTPLAT
ncbi:MAG: PilZ domain-containing protein [Candidatus Sulfotelmatobacter sp.]|jgi:hypothetical protein